MVCPRDDQKQNPLGAVSRLPRGLWREEEGRGEKRDSAAQVGSLKVGEQGTVQVGVGAQASECE